MSFLVTHGNHQPHAYLLNSEPYARYQTGYRVEAAGDADARRACVPPGGLPHPAGNPGANLTSISHRCYLREVAFEWELTQKRHLFAPGLSRGRAAKFTCFVNNAKANHQQSMRFARRSPINTDLNIARITPKFTSFVKNPKSCEIALNLHIYREWLQKRIIHRSLRLAVLWGTPAPNLSKQDT